MQITFKTAKMKKIFEQDNLLKKEYGDQCAKKIKLRLSVLKAASNLDCVPKAKPDRCHGLRGSREGQYAVDLLHPFRLIFVPDMDEMPLLEDGTVNLKKITCIKIMNVEDYH